MWNKYAQYVNLDKGLKNLLHKIDCKGLKYPIRTECIIINIPIVNATLSNIINNVL